MMKRCGLTDTEHMLGDSTEISDEKGAVQGNEVQRNEVHKERDDNTGSCNTQNTLLTTENNCASFRDTTTEKTSWCLVGLYTADGKNKDGTYPLVEAQEYEEGRLQYRIHEPKKSNHESPVQWGRFVLDEGSFYAFATTPNRMVKHVRYKLNDASK